MNNILFHLQREKQMEQLRQELLETKAYEDKKKKCEFVSKI